MYNKAVDETNPNQSTLEMETGENPVKKLGYNPKAEGTRYGPELKGEYKGGFGQFIMKESSKSTKKTPIKFK